MAAAMNTILVIGGTSGIGESFVKRWSSLGKKVIVTGRRQDRLYALKSAIPGLESYAMHNTDLTAVPSHVNELFRLYPNIDTVWINSGIQCGSSIKDISSSTDSSIIDEITLNVTAPMVIARHIVPLLLQQKFPTTFIITSSGLGYVPMGQWPVYCATKAAIHSYLVGIHQTMQNSSVSVVEIVPPAVRTDLGGGLLLDPKFPAMDMKDFTDEIFHGLEKGKHGEMKEIAAGTAVPRVEAWRGSIGKILKERKLGG